MDINEFTEQYKIQIGADMLKKRRFYLDTKYWIIMREASKRSASATQTAIYNKLKILVDSHIVVCPLSPHVFFELMNIKDENKRRDTARVMDEFSRQVTFISPTAIAGQELITFIRNYQNNDAGRQKFEPAKYVWTKVAYILGEWHPYYEQLPKETLDNIQVEHFKHMSNITLEEMVGYLKNPPSHDSDDVVNKLNLGKDAYQDWSTFDDVFLKEVVGILDILRDEIKDVLKYLSHAHSGHIPSDAEVTDSRAVELMQTLIYEAFRQKKITKELPFVHIQAAIHAFFRYNKEQRFKKNDMVDISHASWALPYCHAFFTERRLAGWLCDKPLALQEIYETEVLYDEDEVLDYLSKQ